MVAKACNISDQQQKNVKKSANPKRKYSVKSGALTCKSWDAQIRYVRCNYVLLYKLFKPAKHIYIKQLSDDAIEIDVDKINFVSVAKLGQGAYGKVYLMNHDNYNFIVKYQLLDQGYMEEYATELTILRMLNQYHNISPHFIFYYGHTIINNEISLIFAEKASGSLFDKRFMQISKRSNHRMT